MSASAAREGILDDEPGGWVALVGGGPGEPGLITVRGMELLSRADVVVADRLAPRGLLDNLSPGTEVIDASKRPGNHLVPQDGIDARAIERRDGKDGDALQTVALEQHLDVVEDLGQPALGNRVDLIDDDDHVVPPFAHGRQVAFVDEVVGVLLGVEDPYEDVDERQRLVDDRVLDRAIALDCGKQVRQYARVFAKRLRGRRIERRV